MRRGTSQGEKPTMPPVGSESTPDRAGEPQDTERRAAEGRIIHTESLPGGEDAVRFDGDAHGASVSFFLTRNRPGTGPGLHRHPYEETFIIEAGEARFTIGAETLDLRAGQIVVVPAGVAHAFVNTGEGPLRQVNIHPAGRMETEWLE